MDPFVAATTPGPTLPERPIALDPSITQPIPTYRDGWFNAIQKEDFDALKDKLGKLTPNATVSRFFDSVEQLIRWRLFAETGGGLMAELGSHQLDACSIFLGKVHPLAVTGIGIDRSIDPDAMAATSRTTFSSPTSSPARTTPRASPAATTRTISSWSLTRRSARTVSSRMASASWARGTMIVESEQKLMLFSEKQPGGQEAERNGRLDDNGRQG